MIRIPIPFGYVAVAVKDGALKLWPAIWANANNDQGRIGARGYACVGLTGCALSLTSYATENKLVSVGDTD